MDDKFIRIDKLINYRYKIQKSEGYIEWERFIKSRSSYLIFLDNNRQVKLILKHFRNKRIDKMELDGSRHKMQRKLVTNLFNVIGSAFSFIDHLNYRNEFQFSYNKNKIPVLFRYIRNFIVHENTFPLISKFVSNASGERNFQTMNIDLFLNYLKKRKDEELLNGSKINKVKQIDKIIDYVLKDLSADFDFEEIYLSYLQYIRCYQKEWVKSCIRKNRKIFNFLLQDIKELKKICFDNDQTKDAGIYHLSNSKIRYLEILLGKKSWNI